MRSSFKLKSLGPTKSPRRGKKGEGARTARQAPSIEQSQITLLLRDLRETGRVILHGDNAIAVLELALSTFNDAGTPAATLDEELQEIDDLLETMGYEPGNAPREVNRLIQRCRRAEKATKVLPEKPRRKGVKPSIRPRATH